MQSFLEIPEALDHLAGQGWLSPDEPVRIAPGCRPGPVRLGWREAAIEIASILRQVFAPGRSN